MLQRWGVLMAFVAAFALAGESFGQSPVQVQLLVDPPEITVGDPITFTLQVNHPLDSRVVPLRVEEQWGPFEVIQLAPLESGNNQATEQNAAPANSTSTQQIRATLWSTGTYTTSIVALIVIGEDGSEVSYDVAPVTVNVRSVLQPGDDNLRDIKPQATLPFPSVWQALLIALGLVLLLALLAWLWKRWRQGQISTEPSNDMVIDTRPPHIVALDELQRITALHLPTQRRFAEHYDLVTDALRRYLVQGFNVPALDLTTAELRQTLRRGPLDIQGQATLLRLLDEADLVKFANVEPDFAAASRLPEIAKEFVLAVTPVPRMAADERGMPPGQEDQFDDTGSSNEKQEERL